jgi:hypothetical protein
MLEYMLGLYICGRVYTYASNNVFISYLESFARRAGYCRCRISSNTHSRTARKNFRPCQHIVRLFVFVSFSTTRPDNTWPGNTHPHLIDSSSLVFLFFLLRPPPPWIPFIFLPPAVIWEEQGLREITSSVDWLLLGKYPVAGWETIFIVHTTITTRVINTQLE